MRVALGVVSGLLMSAAFGPVATVAGQNGADTAEAHVARAKAAAGDTYQNLFTFLCAAPGARGGAPRAGAPRAGGPAGAAARGGGRGPAVPDRSSWYVEPVRVFDNLLFVGQSEYTAWAITTSDGIILIDALFDYAVEEAVAGGLKKLGADPATIKYVVVTHPHPDHHGGARFLQERYGARVIMSAADWDVIDGLSGNKPARDLVAVDGQALTLGDTTVTLHVTPGHTPGTISPVFSVRDGGQPHTVAMWGGTGLNADRASLEQYVASAKRFAGLARAAGADVLLSNHTDWDGSKVHLRQLASRAPGGPHPSVVGAEGVRRYLEVAEACATARLRRLP